jgi:hypothetical protein
MGKPLTLYYVPAGKYVRAIETGATYYIEGVSTKKYKGRSYKTWSLRVIPTGSHHWMKGAEAKKTAVEIMVLAPEK